MSSDDSVEQLSEFMKNRKTNDVSIEKIMDKFIVVDKNLILKTDIENSYNFTMLRTIADDMKRRGLKESARTLNAFCDWYIKVRVSNKRMSRKEILDAISAIKRENTTSSIGAKLFGFGDKKEGKE